MNYFYIAVTVEQDKNETIFTERTKAPEMGLYAYAIKVSEQENLKGALDCIGGLKYCNLCPTMKRAKEIVQFWNDSYKANGRYLFDVPTF